MSAVADAEGKALLGPHKDGKKGEVVLRVADVSLTLGGHAILDGVSFDAFNWVRVGTIQGQVISLLGPSGIGKSRLLRIIAGLDAPTAGGVTGTNGARLEPGSVGVVFQDYPVLRHRTVRSNLELAGRIGGLSADASKARATALLSTFGLEDRESFYPAQLSGGQRQRVAIAQQIMKPRALLLMDEPFSGLDPAALDDVMRLVVSVANLDELNTVVLVTHDIRSALAVSDTVFMLGRNRKDDKPVPGAKIQATYDLVDRGLAWRDDVQEAPDFRALEREIKAHFRLL